MTVLQRIEGVAIEVLCGERSRIDRDAELARFVNNGLDPEHPIDANRHAIEERSGADRTSSRSALHHYLRKRRQV